MKIPPNAKRVFTGVIFEVYQWEQELYDGSSATFEMLKRPDTVLVIPVINEKILISEQEQPDKPPYYSLLGGRQDPGESLEDAARRELLEEAGIQSASIELWKAYEPLSKLDWTVYVYIAKNCQKVADQNLDPGEKIRLEEVPFEEFLSIMQSEKFWGGELALDLLRMEKEPEKLIAFKQKLFS